MRPSKPPRLATWLLEELHPDRERTPIAGDLIEAYHSGHSRGWYWREVLVAMLPELRAEKMKEVAARIKDEFDGDLRSALTGPITKTRKILKSFHSIADPGADRILLFAGIQPVAAVPSNCTGVLERIRVGAQEKNYNASYRTAQRMIDAEVPATFDARMRAYLLLKRHGQELCKRTKPKCTECPVRGLCAFVNHG